MECGPVKGTLIPRPGWRFLLEELCMHRASFIRLRGTPRQPSQNHKNVRRQWKWLVTRFLFYHSSFWKRPLLKLIDLWFDFCQCRMLLYIAHYSITVWLLVSKINIVKQCMWVKDVFGSGNAILHLGNGSLGTQTFACLQYLRGYAVHSNTEHR